MTNDKLSITSRRALLQSAGAGFGYLALAGLLGEAALKASVVDKNAPNPLAPKQPTSPPRQNGLFSSSWKGPCRAWILSNTSPNSR